MTAADNKAAQKERLKQKTVVTSRLSETTRFVAFGIVAWVFAGHDSDADFSTNYIEAYKIWINMAGALAVIAIACDYFQYLSAYLSVKHALTRKQQNYMFNKNHPAYYFQTLCFIIKQVAVGLGAITVTSTFTLHILCNG